MAVYKVPQDVEADDKLLGPFSFKQFVFLIVAVGMIALAWAQGSTDVGLPRGSHFVYAQTQATAVASRWHRTNGRGDRPAG